MGRGRGARARNVASRRRVFNKRVKRVISRQGEDKYVASAVLAESKIPAAHVIVKITPPTQGNDKDDRDGDVILDNKLFFQLRVTRPQAAIYARESYRFILIRWLQDDAAITPTVDYVLEQTNDRMTDGYDIDKRRTFNVLMDKRVTIGSLMWSAYGGKGDNIIYRRWFVPLRMRRHQFNAGVALTGKGNYYLLCIGEGNAEAGAISTHLMSVTYHFKDV